MTESKDERKERSRRQVKPPFCFDEEYSYYSIYCNYCDALTPSDFQEATTCNEANKSIDSEMDSLVNKLPKDEKVLDVKWVYKRKSESVSEYKARLLVRAFNKFIVLMILILQLLKCQILNKLLLSYCCQNSLAIH